MPACSGPGPASRSLGDPRKDNAVSLTIAQAEPLGFSPSRLRRVSETARGYVDQGIFPGVSVIVARHGQVVLAESYGLRDIAARQPMALDTILRIYSMTKPVTSVAMMMLYEEGRFNLFDPVSRYIPAFAEPGVLLDRGDFYTDMDREPTIRDLFTHTAGLAYGTGDTPLDQALCRGGAVEHGPRTHPGRVAGAADVGALSGLPAGGAVAIQLRHRRARLPGAAPLGPAVRRVPAGAHLWPLGHDRHGVLCAHRTRATVSLACMAHSLGVVLRRFPAC